MASYKVPQDVEAEDKLIGPFSFRQFIYLIIVALAIALAWALWQVFIPLAAIPLPIIILFSALALPLKKDQPMETYLAAVISFYLKPRIKLWDPDGVEQPIEIYEDEALDDEITLKNLSQSEADKRLEYLANLADTKGWSIRGVDAQQPNSSMNNDVYFEAQQTEDVLDDDNSTAQVIDQKINQSNVKRREQAIATMTQPIKQKEEAPISVSAPEPVAQTNQTTAETLPKLAYNPYPNEIKQTVIQPLEAQYQAKAASIKQPSTSTKVVSADIINLANNNDLTIETIAREANRLKNKQSAQKEVIISLH